MESVVPGVLMRSSRPGYPSHDVDAKEVDDWIEQAKSHRVHTVLCLLDDHQLSYYRHIGKEGLLRRYGDAPFTVIHRQIKDHLSPPVPKGILERISSDFLAAELPMLVHCSAGVDRTGHVVRYLTRQERLPCLRRKVEDIMEAHKIARGPEHFRHVTCLALRLYDELAVIHKLGPRYRSVLWVSSMLHDIGTVLNGPPQGHAWRSGLAILSHKDELDRKGLTPVDEVATVAALHGIDGVSNEDPLGPVHESIKDWWSGGEIPPELQMLAGILRVADGLDRNLAQTVSDITVSGRSIKVVVKRDADAGGNIERAREKSGLLCSVTNVMWQIGAQE